MAPVVRWRQAGPRPWAMESNAVSVSSGTSPMNWRDVNWLPRLERIATCSRVQAFVQEARPFCYCRGQGEILWAKLNRSCLSQNEDKRLERGAAWTKRLIAGASMWLAVRASMSTMSTRRNQTATETRGVTRGLWFRLCSAFFASANSIGRCESLQFVFAWTHLSYVAIPMVITVLFSY